MEATINAPEPTNRKFEIKDRDPAPWLRHLQNIAVFCNQIGVEADAAGKPLTLHLTVYPKGQR